MAMADLMSVLYSKEKSPMEFQFDNLWIPNMYNYITPYHIDQLYKIATSIRYSAKINMKYKAIDNIMKPLGFKKFHCGTNRIVYSYLEDTRFLVKIAIDKVGLGDNPAEYNNQFLLKPFVTKTFQLDPTGVIAFVERVQPITSKAEFKSLASDIFDIITNKIIGKYVVDDIGAKYFMNYGIRNGVGPVLLDYPYVYPIDGKKLYCNKQDLITGQLCNGTIDYDEGFNSLRCSKCGKPYLAIDLRKKIEKKEVLIKDEGEINMKVCLARGNEVVKEFADDSEYIKEADKNPEMEIKSYISGLENIKSKMEKNKECQETLSKIDKGEYHDPTNEFEVKHNFIPRDNVSTKKECFGNYQVDKVECDDCNESIDCKADSEGKEIKESNTLPSEIKSEKKEEVKTKDTKKPNCFGTYKVNDGICSKCKHSELCKPNTEKKKQKDIIEKYQHEFGVDENYENFEKIQKRNKIRDDF